MAARWDPYTVLGIEPGTADAATIKAAFRKHALSCHPDVSGAPEAAAKFAEIKRAADALLQSSPHGGHGSHAYEWPRAGSHHAEAYGAWRSTSRRRLALALSAASLLGGCGLFMGALLVHDGMYDYLTPQAAQQRIRHPTPQRQQLLEAIVTRQQRPPGGAAEAQQTRRA